MFKIDENTFNYAQHRFFENENLFFGFKMAAYETIKTISDDKYEYILPEITLDKNL